MALPYCYKSREVGLLSGCGGEVMIVIPEIYFRPVAASELLVASARRFSHVTLILGSSGQ